MTRRIESRRTFLTSAGGAVVTHVLSTSVASANEGTGSVSPKDRPLFVSTWPFGKAANERARETVGRGGSILDAIEQGIRLTESAGIESVGLSGGPNAAGVRQLDACIMNGPGHQAGRLWRSRRRRASDHVGSARDGENPARDAGRQGGAMVCRTAGTRDRRRRLRRAVREVASQA